MKVYAVNDDRYIIDVEDEFLEALMVKENEDGTLKLFTRTSTKESLANSAYWEEPTEEKAQEILSKLSDYEIEPPPKPLRIVRGLGVLDV